MFRILFAAVLLTAGVTAIAPQIEPMLDHLQNLDTTINP